MFHGKEPLKAEKIHTLWDLFFNCGVDKLNLDDHDGSLGHLSSLGGL